MPMGRIWCGQKKAPRLEKPGGDLVYLLGDLSKR
jgi:hypothetical protein